MCLRKVDSSPKHSYGTGYKVFEDNDEGRPQTWVAHHIKGVTLTTYSIGRWYRDPKEGYAYDCSVRMNYLTGFHIMLSKKDALAYDKQCTTRAIYKVRFRKVVATGLDGSKGEMPTVVAREMMLMERVG